LSTATQTVLFTDLADYTGRVSRSDREGLRRILSEHEDVVRPLVEAGSGRIVKNIGDSFLCVFPSATDGLQTALAIFANDKLGGGADIRIAVTTGDVEEIDGDVFGSAVNVAARILELTPAGECWFGTGARVCMNETEIPWEEVGRFSLKGIPEEHYCFRIVPTNRTWLPRRVEEAIESSCLVRMGPGERPPLLPADPVILLERFDTGSRELKVAMASLPVLEPQAFYLAEYNIAMSDRHEWLTAGHGLIIGTPEAIDAAIIDARDQLQTHNADTFSLDPEETMMLTRGSRADVELVICGLALPAVPFSDIVARYAYDLLPDGRWVTRSTRAILRVEVDPEGASLTALVQDVSMGGAVLPSGKVQRLTERTNISTPVGVLEFVPTSRYAGVILHDTDMRLALRNGQLGELGRSPGSPGLAFPNRPGQENIQWCSGQRADKARENGFTLDRVLAGRQQAAIEFAGDSLRLTPLHGECPTYVMRDGKLGQAKKAVRVTFGDMIVAGTTVVAIRRPE
jgi:class 3 adenylate cyclase